MLFEFIIFVKSIKNMTVQTLLRQNITHNLSLSIIVNY